MSIKTLRIVVIGFILVLAAWWGFNRKPPVAFKPVIFSVIGDVPYSAKDEKKLLADIEAHNRVSPAQFLVHVGDIKKGLQPCADIFYQNVAAILKLLKVPAFIVPGDNEYNDCSDPAAAWSLWVKHFMRLEENWNGIGPVERQNIRPENFAFVRQGVLFIGLNIVGGRVHSAKEWKKREADNAQWVTEQFTKNSEQVYTAVIFCQAFPKDTLYHPLSRFPKPVLIVHGDGHRFHRDRPWPGFNVTRVQVDQGGAALPLEVTVTPQSRECFSFNRKPW